MKRNTLIWYLSLVALLMREKHKVIIFKFFKKIDVSQVEKCKYHIGKSVLLIIIDFKKLH